MLHLKTKRNTFHEPEVGIYQKKKKIHRGKKELMLYYLYKKSSVCGKAFRKEEYDG